MCVSKPESFVYSMDFFRNQVKDIFGDRLPKTWKLYYIPISDLSETRDLAKTNKGSGFGISFITEGVTPICIDGDKDLTWIAVENGQTRTVRLIVAQNAEDAIRQWNSYQQLLRDWKIDSDQFKKFAASYESKPKEASALGLLAKDGKSEQAKPDWDDHLNMKVIDQYMEFQHLREDLRQFGAGVDFGKGSHNQATVKKTAGGKHDTLMNVD